MPRSFLTKTSLLIILILSIPILYWSLNQKDESPPASLEEKRAEQKISHHPFSIKGVTFSSYDENSNLLVKVEADDISIGRRKFWIFNVRPFNEAVVNNARLDLYLDNDSSSETDIYSHTRRIISSDLPGYKGDGIVTRGVINKISLNIFRSGSLAMSVSADKAYINIRGKQLKLIGTAIMDMAQDRLIKSDLVFWNDKERRFDIPGEYIEILHDKRSKGKGLTLRALER